MYSQVCKTEIYTWGEDERLYKFGSEEKMVTIFTFYTILQGFSKIFVLLQNIVISLIFKAHSRQRGERMQNIMFSCCVQRFVLIVSQLTGDRASF